MLMDLPRSSTWAVPVSGCRRQWLGITLSLATLAGATSTQTGEVRSVLPVSTGLGGFTGPVGPGFGRSVAVLGDLDGDGVQELMVGDTGPGGGGSTQGRLWVLFQNADGTIRSETRISAGEGGFNGPLADDGSFGVSLAPVGDLDGNGTLEVAVGQPNYPTTFGNTGAVWLLSLDSTGAVVGERAIAHGQSGFHTGTMSGAGFGSAVEGLWDVDGNGVADLAAGAPTETLLNIGAVYVLFLASDGSVVRAQRLNNAVGGATVGTLVPQGEFGSSVARWGANHLAIGSRWGGAGELRMVTLDSTGKAVTQVFSTDVPWMTLPSSRPSLLASYSWDHLDTIGDLDGNGAEDLILNADDPVLLFLETDGRARTLHRISAKQDLGISPMRGGVAGLGDQDGDGRLEVFIGDGSTTRLSSYGIIELDDSGFLPPGADFTLDLASSTGLVRADLEETAENNVRSWSWTVNGVGPYYTPLIEGHVITPGPLSVTLTVEGIAGSDSVTRVVPMASAVAPQFNGLGINPLCHWVNPPVVGQEWFGTIDTTGFPAATAVAMLVYAESSSGTMLFGGELLLDLSSKRHLSFLFGAKSQGGYHSFGTIPLDADLIGEDFATQAAVLSPGSVQLCNGTVPTIGI